MTVQELIDILHEQDDKSAQVVLSSDSEGNTFSPLDTVELGQLYRPYSDFSGEIVYDGSTAEEGIDSECVVLWPQN